MELQLKNPIIFFDLETTGPDIVKDRIIEISILKIYPNGKEENKTFRVNPEMPISAQATKVHGITDDDVRNEQPFSQMAQTVANFIKGCDFAGYNSNRFDIPLLAEEFLRANVDFDFKRHKFVDVQVIFHKKEQRTLGAAYQFYCGKSLHDAHSAKADTLATYEVLKAQLDRYPDLQNDIDALASFSIQNRNADFAGRIVFDDNDAEVFNFGKYKGQKVQDVLQKDPGYYSWMLNGDFPLYTKKVLTQIKLRGAFANSNKKS